MDSRSPSDEAQRPLGPSERNRWMVSEKSANLVRRPVQPRPITVQTDGKLVTLDLSRTAIITIDMQNDFCHSGGWLAHIGVDIAPARTPIAPLQRLLPALRDHDVPVIWLNWGNRPDKLNLSPALLHVYKPSGTGVGLGDALPGLGRKGAGARQLVGGDRGRIDADPSDIQVAKYRMSGFQDTELDSILRNLGVTTLLFAGVNADQCVLCTLQDANFLGYDCLLLRGLRGHNLAGLLHGRDPLQCSTVFRLCRQIGCDRGRTCATVTSGERISLQPVGWAGCRSRRYSRHCRPEGRAPALARFLLVQSGAQRAADGKSADLIVVPRDETDVIHIAAACARHRVPMTVRAAAPEITARPFR